MCMHEMRSQSKEARTVPPLTMFIPDATLGSSAGCASLLKDLQLVTSAAERQLPPCVLAPLLLHAAAPPHSIAFARCRTWDN
jgi:hypothetical protein